MRSNYIQLRFFMVIYIQIQLYRPDQPKREDEFTYMSWYLNFEKKLHILYTSNTYGI